MDLAWFCALGVGVCNSVIAVVGKAVPERATCYRQDGSVHELPLERSSSGLAVELSLDRWECAVVRMEAASWKLCL